MLTLVTGQYLRDVDAYLALEIPYQEVVYNSINVLNVDKYHFDLIRYANNIVHELRNPLHSYVGMIIESLGYKTPAFRSCQVAIRAYPMLFTLFRHFEHKSEKNYAPSTSMTVINQPCQGMTQRQSMIVIDEIIKSSKYQNYFIVDHNRWALTRIRENIKRSLLSCNDFNLNLIIREVNRWTWTRKSVRVDSNGADR